MSSPKPRRLIVGTGWKMNGGIQETSQYAAQLLPLLESMTLTDIDIFVLPPFTSLPAAARVFNASPVMIGGQNMHWEASGSFTGEISAAMLSEVGCRYVELAHSERLTHFGESYDAVQKKVDQALANGLTPIICLGETAEEKAAGQSDAILSNQLLTALAGQTARPLPEVVFAYEPRWAINSAEAASPAYIAERHQALRETLRQQHGQTAAEQTRIMYGGSVTPENAPAIIALDDVDGLFVGRAAWTAAGFAQIITQVNNANEIKKRQLFALGADS